MKTLAECGEEFPEGATVGLDLMPRDLYLFRVESKTMLCSGID